MLLFNQENLKKWNKKVVYAPNSFGKTTVAAKIFDYYKEQSYNCDIFTRRKIGDLVSVAGKDVFVGKKSILHKELIELQTKLESTKAVGSIFAHTKEKSATRIKQSSFYASYIQIKNANSIPSIDKSIKSKHISLRKFKENDIEILDKVLDYDLFNKVKSFLEKSNEIDTKIVINKNILNDNLVSDEIFKSLEEIYLYCKLNRVKQCFLCGKKYRSHENLIQSIEKRLKSLRRTKDDLLYELYVLSLKVLQLIENKDSIILKEIAQNNNTTKRQLLILKLYYQLCLSDASHFQNKLINIKIDADEKEEFTIEEAINRKRKLENSLKIKTKKEEEAIKRYNNFVIKEIRNYINLNDSIEVKALENAPGFEFLINGKNANPYENLSESEIKLLSLIVLNAEIKYQHLEVVILDDPIDSYDDYNKRIASNYISELIKKPSIKNWFIFTNDFECVYYLSKMLKKETIFNLDDIDKIYVGIDCPYEVAVRPNEVEIIAKNDLYYLGEFINVSSTKFPYNQDILFCALTLTLRNLKTDILNNYPNIEITPITKITWANDIKNIIESCCEHFNITNSPNLKISDVAKPFLALKASSKKSNAKVFSNNNNLYEQFRENVAKSPSVRTGNFTDVVNYLFKKILLINYIKYSFEKKLMLLVSSVFSTTDFNQVDSCNTGLNSRIKMALDLNNNHGYMLENKLKEFLNVHEKYSLLYNAIDHGTSLVISPYLSVSIKDISDFNNAVDFI